VVSKETVIIWVAITYNVIGNSHCFERTCWPHIQVDYSSFLQNPGNYLPGCTVS